MDQPNESALNPPEGAETNPGADPVDHPQGEQGSTTPIEREETLEVRAGSLAALTNQIALLQAADLARAGRYSQAEEVLDAIQDEETPAMLDLRARIRAQQGKLGEAQTLWERALAQDPGNPEFTHGLEYVQKAQKPVRTRWLFSGGFWVAVIGILMITLGAFWLNRWNKAANQTLTDIQGLAQEIEINLREGNRPATAAIRPSQTQEGPPPGATALPGPAAAPEISPADIDRLRQELIDSASVNQATLSGQIAQLQAGQAEILAGLQPTPGVQIGIQTNIPGIQIIPEAEAAKIRFDEGLFAYGWTLKPAARQLLIELAAQLVQSNEIGQIKLVGFQTNEETEPFFDLGLLRAIAVYDFLVSSTQLPADIFVISPQGRRPLPFPVDTQANRSRNRTVEIYISPGLP